MKRKKRLDKTSREQIEAVDLKGYGRPTYNKLVHSATTRSTVVGVIHKLGIKSTILWYCIRSIGAINKLVDGQLVDYS